MKALKIGDLNVNIPIIQGGMGVCISLSGLASAVANEGGIGVISAVGIGMLEPDYMKNFRKANKRALAKEIIKAKRITKGILGVNIMMAATDYEDLLKTAINENIDIVFVGAGLPIKDNKNLSYSIFKEVKTKFVPKISSARAANIILQYWARKYNHVPDAFAVEGPLAGGHLGYKKKDLIENGITLSSLVEGTVKVIEPYEQQFNKEIPVIAAGGIYTGKDMFEIMQHGAKGVKIGTRFVTTYECDASIKFKEAYLNSNQKDITIIDSPVGLPGRVIKNEFVEQVIKGNKVPYKCYWQCLKSCDYKNVQYCIAQALFNAARGNMSEGICFAGTNAYMAKKIQSVKETINEIITEYNHLEHC